MLDAYIFVGEGTNSRLKNSMNCDALGFRRTQEALANCDSPTFERTEAGACMMKAISCGSR